MPNDNVAPPAERTEVTGTALLTLNPEQYVTAVFAPFRDRLATAKTEAAAVTVVDCTTSDGMKVAIKHRAMFRALRVEAEKARQDRKKPILEIGRLLDSRAKELEAEITPLEDRFDTAIKAEEKRREDEKAARERAEAERVTKIKASITAIRGVIIDVAGRPSAEIEAAIQHLVAGVITRETVQEFLDEALAMRDQTLAKLREMHAAQVRAEEEAARVKAEREELDRRRAEQDAREREAQERAAAEQRRVAEAEAERLRAIKAEEDAARARIEAQEREARQRAFEEERRLAVERERIATEARELEARQRQEREAVEAREREERAVQEERERQERLAREQQERQERDRVEAEQRQRQADERAAREAQDAEERERTRVELERTDIREGLKQLRVRVTGIAEFAWYAAAFDKHHTPKTRAKRAA